MLFIVTVPEKSSVQTPNWWNPLRTDRGFKNSVSQMCMEESLPTCSKMYENVYESQRFKKLEMN